MGINSVSMNLSKMTAHKGQLLRLFPQAQVWTPTEPQHIDDLWMLMEVRDGNCVELRNERTNHVVQLSPDHVHHFTSSTIQERKTFAGWLELNVCIDLSDDVPKVTPIPSGVARTLPSTEQPPLRVRLKAVLDTINPAICEIAKPGMSISVMISDHHLRDLLKIKSEAGFSEMLSMRSNGNVAMGQGAGGGCHFNDMDQVGVRHGFVLQFGHW